MRALDCGRVVLMCCVVSLVAACGVPKEEHSKALSELAQTREELTQAQQQVNEQSQQIQAMEQRVNDLSAQIAAKEEQIKQQEGALTESKGNLAIYESKAGNLEKALKASRAELEELRKARAAAERAAQQYRQLTERLASMVQAGRLEVKIRRGRMVLQLADNILFDTGKSELREDGERAITEVANVLKEIADRQYLVTGHSDNVPIKSSNFKSNWELSAARAVEVVKQLQKSGVDPKQLAAAGYGEFDPVANNDSKEGRALNRRIEIVLMPNLDEMPQLPSDLSTPKKKS